MELSIPGEIGEWHITKKYMDFVERR